MDFSKYDQPSGRVSTGMDFSKYDTKDTKLPSESLLQRAMRAGKETMMDLPSQQLDIAHPIGETVGNIFKNKLFGINADQPLEDPLGYTKGYFTNPNNIADAMVLGGLTKVPKGTPITINPLTEQVVRKPGLSLPDIHHGYDIMRTGSKPVNKRIGEVEAMGQSSIQRITSQASKEQSILEAQREWQKGNLKSKQADLMRGAEDEAARMALGEESSMQSATAERQNMLQSLAEKQKFLESQKGTLGGKLSESAKAESMDAESRYQLHLRKMGDEWEARVKAIGQKHKNVEIDANEAAQNLRMMIEKERGVTKTEEGGSGLPTTTDSYILKLADDLENRGTIRLDEALTELSKLKQRMKTGAGYSTSEHFLSEAQDKILEVGQKYAKDIGGLRSWWASHAQQRNAAIKSFGMFSKKGVYDPTGRKFLEKISLGKAMPEESQLVSDLEGKVGKIGTSSRELGGKIQSVESEAQRISDEIDALSKNPIKATSKSAEFLQAKKQEITTAIQKEVDELNLAIDRESASIGNESVRKVGEVSQKTEASLSRLRDLRRRVDVRQHQLRKMAAIGTFGTGVAALVLFKRQMLGMIREAGRMVGL